MSQPDDTKEQELQAALERFDELFIKYPNAEACKVVIAAVRELKAERDRLREEMASMKKDHDQITYAIQRGGHALIKTEYGYEIIRGPFRPLGNEPPAGDGIYGA